MPVGPKRGDPPQRLSHCFQHPQLHTVALRHGNGLVYSSCYSKRNAELNSESLDDRIGLCDGLIICKPHGVRNAKRLSDVCGFGVSFAVGTRPVVVVVVVSFPVVCGITFAFGSGFGGFIGFGVGDGVPVGDSISVAANVAITVSAAPCIGLVPAFGKRERHRVCFVAGGDSGGFKAGICTPTPTVDGVSVGVSAGIASNSICLAVFKRGSQRFCLSKRFAVRFPCTDVLVIVLCR
ncbi:hypothetical protein FNF28_04543 [Cafeteria roenbergensis]|uniref:Uncharacterized protein n=1 Tax=Cafeteria roenbergensis TaxID=33653 RepID=A0A5A8DBP1_CAFRO|nr:hypothetical protein FNF28_04543 [Cafeteria roenbergensis]